MESIYGHMLNLIAYLLTGSLSHRLLVLKYQKDIKYNQQTIVMLLWILLVIIGHGNK